MCAWGVVAVKSFMSGEDELCCRTLEEQATEAVAFKAQTLNSNPISPKVRDSRLKFSSAAEAYVGPSCCAWQEDLGC